MRLFAIQWARGIKPELIEAGSSALTKPFPGGEAFESPYLWEGVRAGQTASTLIIHSFDPVSPLKDKSNHFTLH
jgi:hypothetical protein